MTHFGSDRGRRYDRQHVGGETLHSDLPGGDHTLRRQQGPLCGGAGAPHQAELFHFCGNDSLGTYP